MRWVWFDRGSRIASRAVVAVLAVGLGVVGPARAAGVPHAEELEQIDRLLDGGDWAGAKDAASALERAIFQKRISDKKAPVFFAEMLTRRAVAEAALGNADAASWDFHSAAVFDLAGARAAAARWPAVSLPKLRERLQSTEGKPSDGEIRLVDGSLVAGHSPVRLSSPLLPLVRQLGAGSRPEHAVIGLIVGTDGRTHMPLLDPATRCGPTRLLGALEEVRIWTFRPATTAAGNPVASLFTLTMNYVSAKAGLR